MDENSPNEKELICSKEITPSIARSSILDNVSFSEKLENAFLENVQKNSDKYAETFCSIFKSLTNCFVKAKDIEMNIAKIKVEHNLKLDKMEMFYQNKKKTIEDTLDLTRSLRKQLESMDLNSLDEEGHEAYKFILGKICDLTMGLIKMSDEIM